MKLLRTLLFFPSLTFNIFNAEIFPWAFIYGVIKSKHIGYRLFFIILFNCLNFLTSKPNNSAGNIPTSDKTEYLPPIKLL